MTATYIMQDQQYNEIDNVRMSLEAVAALAANGRVAYEHDLTINREALSELIINFAERLKNALNALEYERR